jgi:hypothetical protein
MSRRRIGAPVRSTKVRLEMLSVLRSTDTGIRGAVLWIAAGEFAEGGRPLGPRLLLVLGDEILSDRLTFAVSVLLTRPPEVLGVLPPGVAHQVERFVAVNRDALLGHWRGEIDTRETLDRLARVSP